MEQNQPRTILTKLPGYQELLQPRTAKASGQQIHNAENISNTQLILRLIDIAIVIECTAEATYRIVEFGKSKCGDGSPGQDPITKEEDMLSIEVVAMLLALTTKSLILVLYWNTRILNKMSRKLWEFTKAIIATFYCSHMLPLIAYD